MIEFGRTVSDRELEGTEQELRALLGEMPAEPGPSQPYWDMYAHRVMARIEREQSAPVFRLWRMVNPLMAIAAAAAAVAFIVVQPSDRPDHQLDQVTASLPSETVQVLRQNESPMSPTAASDVNVASELAPAAESSGVDLDAALAFADSDPDQIDAAWHQTSDSMDSSDMFEINDDDATNVIAAMKNSL